MSDQDKIKALEATIKTQDEEIVSLKKENSGVVEVKNVTFSHENKTYRFRFSHFSIGNKDHVADDVKSDKALCEQIVKEYAGLIELVK